MVQSDRVCAEDRRSDGVRSRSVELWRDPLLRVSFVNSRLAPDLAARVELNPDDWKSFGSAQDAGKKWMDKFQKLGALLSGAQDCVRKNHLATDGHRCTQIRKKFFLVICVHLCPSVAKLVLVFFL